MKLKLFDLLIVALSLVSCSETDSYTHRNEILSKEFPKINDLLNKLTNIHIQRALSTVKSCSVIDLQSALVKELGDMYLGMGMIDTMIGKLEYELNNGFSDLLKHPNGTNILLPVIKTLPKEHIYSEFSLFSEKGFITSGRILQFVNFKFIDRRGNSLILGSDKTAHFFSQGLEYWDVVQKYKKRLENTSLDPKLIHRQAIQSAFEHGILSETNAYGLGIDSTLAGTCIFSNADLAANWQGYHFWDNLVEGMSSVSEKSNFPSTDSDPYFSCSSRVPKAKWSKKQDLVTLENSVGLDSVNELPFINNNNVSQILSNKNQTNSSSTEKFHRWVQLRPFEWETYINPAWDESINSNSFCSKNMQTVFQKRINQLHSKGKLPRAEFPMEEKLCSQMVKFDDSEHLRTYLSQSCLDLAVNNPILDTE